MRNIIGARTRRVPGWNINVDHMQPILANVRRACGNGLAWYGWSNGPTVGSVSTNFKGNGRALLSFGNCWNVGTVRVYLDGRLIGSAKPKVMTKIQFDFSDDSSLVLRDEGQNSVIQVTDLRVISCR